MPDQNQAPAFDPNASYQPTAQPTANPPAAKPAFDPSGSYQPTQEMVTNSAGETMPADVAARHARSREGKDIGPPSSPSFPTSVATGYAKEAVKTLEGVGNLANKALPNSFQIPTSEASINQILPEGAERQKALAQNQDRLKLQGSGEVVGGIGENIIEFASGEEALKGLSLAGRLSKLKKVADVIEEYPRLAKAMHIGTNIMRSAAVGGVQGGVKGAEEDQALTGATGGAIGGAVGAGIGEATAPGLKAAARILGLGGRTSEEALVAAGRPSVSEDVGFRKALTTAAPRIIEAAKESPLKTVGDFEDLLHDTAQNIRQKEFGPMIERHGEQSVSAQPVADNIRSAITDQMREYAPEQADELENFASKFVKNMPLAKAESDLQYFNAELRKFYKLNSVDQSAALKTSGTVAKYEAAADGLRDLIYGRLRDLGENAPEELQRQYGALKNLERVFGKRATVSDRQAPLNLAQILSLAGGAGEAATALLMGHPLAAVAGAVPLAVATAAKMRNAPESLVRQGVKALGREAGPRTPSTGKIAKRATAALGATAGESAGNSEQEDTSNWIPIASQGQRFQIHPEDLDEAKKRDPDLQVLPNADRG
jgi:hypothetical protein